MDSDSSTSTSLGDETVLLAESIATTTFLLRQLSSRKLKGKECSSIFEAVQKEMQSAVTGLKHAVNRVDDADIQIQSKNYLDRVDSVIEDIPQFVSILNKFPKGNPELDVYTAKILGELTQLSIGFASIANVSNNKNLNNKM